MGLTGLIVAATVILPPSLVQVQAALPPIEGTSTAQLLTFDPSLTLAQAGNGYAPVGCRITRDQIGVYQEPNLAEAALGVLAKEETITLGTGSGNGWARIVAPQTGWVQAKFLRGGDATPCPAGQEPVVPTIAAPASVGNETAPVTASPTEGGVTRAVCAVLPDGGLIVRDQPNLTESRVIGSIRPGNYTFQFTGRRTQAGTSQRQWAYITAPAKGWVSTGIVGGGANLSGEGCS